MNRDSKTYQDVYLNSGHCEQILFYADHAAKVCSLKNELPYLPYYVQKLRGYKVGSDTLKSLESSEMISNRYRIALDAFIRELFIGNKLTSGSSDFVEISLGLFLKDLLSENSGVFDIYDDMLQMRINNLISKSVEFEKRYGYFPDTLD
ncbi:MAG: hypothetical protein JKY54_09130 [Flavobacteriales bacterium]|jgi:hypothetical protein|nr:hypothetical protein [Flavobacteriales bacterium]